MEKLIKKKHERMYFFALNVPFGDYARRKQIDHKDGNHDNDVENNRREIPAYVHTYKHALVEAARRLGEKNYVVSDDVVDRLMRLPVYPIGCGHIVKCDDGNYRLSYDDTLSHERTLKNGKTITASANMPSREYLLGGKIQYHEKCKWIDNFTVYKDDIEGFIPFYYYNDHGELKAEELDLNELIEAFGLNYEAKRKESIAKFCFDLNDNDMCADDFGYHMALQEKLEMEEKLK